MRKNFSQVAGIRDMFNLFGRTASNDDGFALEKLRLKKQDRLISLRLSSDLIGLLKTAATKHNTKYQKLIRNILEENIKTYL